MAEISAGILAIGIQEQVVEFAREVVMMRDIPASARHPIELGNGPRHHSKQSYQARNSPVAPPVIIRDQNFEHIGNGALLHRHAPVHIRFAKYQFRPHANGKRCEPAVQTDGCFCTDSAICAAVTVRPDDGQPAVVDKIRK